MLKRAERAMIRRMCGINLSDRINSNEQMDRLGLEESMVEIVKRSGLRRMGHVLRRDAEEPSKKACVLDEDIVGSRERPKMTRKDNVKHNAREIVLIESDAEDRRSLRCKTTDSTATNSNLP